MPHNLYALIVGINDYPARVRPLRGCVPDANAVADYLGALTAQGYQPHIYKLLNEQATRMGIINAFRSHLRDQAGKDDVVLFYYSGHGSQEPCPPEWLSLEPDGFIETLVCYDSRLPNGLDLADKELGQLVREVSASGAHVLVILDACHSGSGTRDFQPDEGVRLADGRWQPRSLDQFLPELREFTRQGHSGNSPSGWQMPASPHILLAACEDRQLARERLFDGQWRGLFTRFLLQALQTANRPLTYHQLLGHVRGLTLTVEPGQTPQLESIGQSPDALFVNGAVQSTPSTFQIRYHQHQGWIVAGGTIHGLQPPTVGQRTELLIFPFDIDLHHATAAQSIASASITLIGATESQIELADSVILDRSQVYQALVIALPLPAMEICFEGDEVGLGLVRQVLASGAGSLYFREGMSSPAYRLLALNDRYLITRPGSSQPVTASLDGYSLSNADLIIFRLEHIARWQQLVDLCNPNSRIAEDAVRIYMTVEGQRVDGPTALAEYFIENGKWVKPEMLLTIENLSDQDVYCAVLGLQENFAITSEYFETATVRIPPGGSQTTSKNRYMAVPNEDYQQGITENLNIYQVIISSVDLEPKVLEQAGLPREINRLVSQPTSAMPKSVLGRLFENIVTRSDSNRRDADEEIEDWTTREVAVTVRRPLQDQSLSPQRVTDLLAGVRIRPHDRLQARAKLVSMPAATRNLDVPSLPRVLEESTPLYFQSSRGNDPGLSVLELTNVENYQVVNPEAPLEIEYSPELLQTSEHVLALAYDPELDCYLPLGYDTQPGVIQLRRLPVPENEDTRSVLGSLKIYFQKLLGQPMGPRLQLVEADGQGQPSYIADINEITRRVSDAPCITLYIHGIFGDTQGMVFSAPQTNPEALYLAYDYENINTPIERIAADLRDDLAQIGLTQQQIGRGKRKKNLRVVAHSLGGLVSRYWIERLGGDKLVSHLVILGTPNAGTPLAVYEDWAVKLLQYKGWAEILLGIGLTINWPMTVLSQIVWWLAEGFDKAAVNLDRVNPNSDFIQDLKRSTDPRVRYTLIAGDTTNLWDDAMRNKLQRLLERLRYQSLSLLYLNKPNDIATTVVSIHSVAWVSEAEKLTILCDHQQYFRSKIGQETQRKVLGGKV